MATSYSRLLSAARRGCKLVRPLSRLWSSFRQQMAEEEAHATRTMVNWRRVSLFVCIPAVSYLTWKHVIVGEEHHVDREWIPYPYLRIRNKPYPWGDGDTTLFHNPRTNLGPEKEETDAPPKTRTGLKSRIQEWWLANLHEDPEERDQGRWDHLAKMQKRRQDYLAKKAKAIDKPVPLQPMNLILEIKYTPVNKIDSEMEN